MNLNYAEFEKETFQNRNETFSNDFNETMNYFRQEKSRQDLFLNKTSPKFKFLNTSNSQKSNTSISKTYQRRKKFETTLLFPQLGFVSPQNQSSNTFSKFYDKNQTSKADLCSSESLCNNYPKVFFSTEMKSILMDDRVKNSLHEKEMDTFIQPGERKHVNRFKNNKNLIFCKDKVIQIKKNDEESSPEREIKENSSETLFMRIIKSGMSPTNYFLNSCHEKK